MSQKVQTGRRRDAGSALLGLAWLAGVALVAGLPVGPARAADAPPPRDLAGEALEWVQRGQELLRVKHPREACECFAHAALLLPTWWIPHFERASCGRLIGDPYDLLLRSAEEAVKQSPASGIAWELLGFVHEDAGFPERAEPAYARAVRLDPRLRGARLRLAFIELAAGRAAAAQERFAAIRAEWPTSAQALSGLAAAAAQNGDTATAEEALLTLAVRSNYPAAVYARLVALYRAAGDDPGARVAERAWRQAVKDRTVQPPLSPRLKRR